MVHQSIPVKIIDGEERFSRCELYSNRTTGENATEACHSWVYEHSEFDNTIATQVSWCWVDWFGGGGRMGGGGRGGGGGGDRALVDDNSDDAYLDSTYSSNEMMMMMMIMMLLLMMVATTTTMMILIIKARVKRRRSKRTRRIRTGYTHDNDDMIMMMTKTTTTTTMIIMIIEKRRRRRSTAKRTRRKKSKHRKEQEENAESAYRKCHNTETASLRVVNDPLQASDSGHVSILSLLDLSAAFDTLDHGVLIKRLHTTFCCSGTVLDWFTSYLSFRTQSV